MAKSKTVHVPSEAAAWPIPREWLVLDDCCEGVFDCPHSTPVLTETGPYVARSQDIRTGVFRTEHAAHVSDETYRERVVRAEPRHGDILYSREGTYFGIAAEVPAGIKVCLGQRMVLIRPKAQWDARFLRLWLNSPTIARHVHGFRDGSVAERLNLPTIRALPIPHFEPQEQADIVSVLTPLDDRIDLNRKTNESLTDLTRSIFTEWFIYFGPTRAKEAGRSGAVPPALAKHFPASLEPSEIGPVPLRWRVERFDAHISAERGLSYKGEGLREGATGMPMHNLNSIYEGGGYKHEGLKYYEGEYREKHIAKPGDMLVTNTEQGFDHLLIGHAALAPSRYGDRTLYSHHIYRVRPLPSSPLTAPYLVELFNSERWHYWISGFSNGTTINMLPLDALQMPLLVVPPSQLVDAFTDFAQAAHVKSEENVALNDALRTTRDALLPRLFSGEIQIRDAEKVVAKAV